MRSVSTVLSVDEVPAVLSCASATVCASYCTARRLCISCVDVNPRRPWRLAVEVVALLSVRQVAVRPYARAPAALPRPSLRLLPPPARTSQGVRPDSEGRLRCVAAARTLWCAAVTCTDVSLSVCLCVCVCVCGCLCARH